MSRADELHAGEKYYEFVVSVNASGSASARWSLDAR
ncbi:hypothetical protein JOF56_003811 [Kibdelosporangium banguiense]|uniref:Uncharacterized protein n=1 Tax=Kibdelosporangium banguiense TaxID=1365924 RepID=A0ABS4THX1_9PSEU|nr:hypothetical protein [Kibdelosporangium banguiense]